MSLRAFSWKTSLLGICAVLASQRDAAGAGYAIMEQGVAGLGNAYAGAAAAAEDASTVFFNPAGLTRLPGSQFLAGVHVVVPSARFTNRGSTDLTGQPLSGGEGGDAGSPLAVPNLYFSRQLGDRFYLGLGLFSPFGLSTEYNADWVGRYHAVKSDLVSLNINPALAWSVTEKLSVGGGISAQYLDAELNNAIDFGSIFGVLGAPGMAPQQNDGFVTFKGDSWSWGYNVGVLYQFDGRTKAGAAYRSTISHTLKGDADFSGAPAFNPTGRFLDTGVKARVTTPDSLSLSLWHNFSSEIAAMADVTWTNWSKLDELRIRFDNPAETDAVTTFRWRDTLRYSLGALYRPGAWTFRAGVAYDESPVRDAAHATPRIPDKDRVWVAGGLGYKLSDAISFALSYAHLFVRDTTIDKSAVGEDRFRGALDGSYDSKVDIVSGELAWRF